MRGLQVRDIVLGEGMPKVCVPLTDRSLEGLVDTIKLAQSHGADLIEWRVDHFDQVNNPALVCSTLAELRSILGNTPLIFTLRRAVEGGAYAINDADYIELLSAAARTKLVDLIDIEYSVGEATFNKLVDICTNYHTSVIGSYHNFELTPQLSFIVKKFSTMRKAGAHIPKIAVMAQNSEDVLRLLSASNAFSMQDFSPFIAISMGHLGVLSRLSGELFGSAMTFASAKQSSAPGQISIEETKQILTLLHQNA